jgi:alpha-1,2-mannosyltransferase
MVPALSRASARSTTLRAISVDRLHLQRALSWRQVAPALAALITVAVVFLPLTPAYDFEVFRHAGYALLHGLPVYPRIGSPAVFSGSAFVYPYFAAWPFALFALAPFGIGAGLFFALSAAAVVFAALAAADRDPVPPVFVLGTAFTITGLQLGTLSPLLFAGTIFLWKLRDRPLAFALLAAPVMAAKVFLLPLLLWPLLARRWRGFGFAILSTAGLLAAGFAFGPIAPSQYLQLLSALGLHEARAGFGLIGALMNVGASRQIAEVCAGALAACTLAAAHVHYRRVADERVLFGAGIVASLILSPVLWSHYLVLLCAVLLVFKVPARWLAVLTLASWAIAPPHGLHMDTDLIHGVASSGTWPVVAAASLFAISRSPRMRGPANAAH